jgi:hypothetical protein
MQGTAHQCACFAYARDIGLPSITTILSASQVATPSCHRSSSGMAVVKAGGRTSCLRSAAAAPRVLGRFADGWHSCCTSASCAELLLLGRAGCSSAAGAVAAAAATCSADAGSVMDQCIFKGCQAHGCIVVCQSAPSVWLALCNQPLTSVWTGASRLLRRGCSGVAAAPSCRCNAGRSTSACQLCTCR